MPGHLKPSVCSHLGTIRISSSYIRLQSSLIWLIRMKLSFSVQRSSVLYLQINIHVTEKKTQTKPSKKSNYVFDARYHGLISLQMNICCGKRRAVTGSHFIIFNYNYIIFNSIYIQSPSVLTDWTSCGSSSIDFSVDKHQTPLQRLPQKKIKVQLQ